MDDREDAIVCSIDSGVTLVQQTQSDKGAKVESGEVIVN